MNKVKGKNYIVFSQKMAGYLMIEGYILKRIETNRNYPGKNVFIFKNTNNIQETIREFKTKFY